MRETAVTNACTLHKTCHVCSQCVYVVMCSKPGMFYFQSVTADKNKMLTCVVLVRERQRLVSH